jgi:hypothetical protein
MWVQVAVSLHGFRRLIHLDVYPPPPQVFDCARVGMHSAVRTRTNHQMLRELVDHVIEIREDE